MTDADYIRAMLKELGMGQREAARVMGISERDMRVWCAGKIDPETGRPYKVLPVVFYALEWLAHQARQRAAAQVTAAIFGDGD